MPAILAAHSVFLVSVIKPLILFAAVLAWARWATIADKDAGYFYLQRRLLNGMAMGAAVLGLVLWLAIPWFGLGLLLFALFTGGAAVTYVMVRNRHVPDDEQWQLNTQGLQRMMNRREQASAERSVTLRFAGSAPGEMQPVPLENDKHYHPYLVLDQLINQALRLKAQRVDVALGSNDLAVRISVDGVAYRYEDIDPSHALPAIDYLKAQCGMDVGDRRRKQVGETTIEVGERGEHTLHVETAGSTRGLTLAIVIDKRSQLDIDFEQLGLLQSQHDQLKPLLVENEGLVLVATPPHSGRTATLYALIQQHDPYLTDIHTLEQPIEADLEGVSQHEPGEGGWAKALNSLLLKDPAVVMLGQLPDAATAQLAAKAATDQKRLYVGVRGDDTFSALKAWVKTVDDRELVASGLRAVISQRPIRKLCSVCRQAYQPDPAALKKMNLPADRISQLYKSSGRVPAPKGQTQPCPMCNGLGFDGRTAAFEVMIIDDEARGFIREGDMNGLRSHLRRQMMLWLQEAALAKVVAGETSISEVMRALGQGEQPGKNDQAAPTPARKT